MSIARNGIRIFATNWAAFPLQLATGIVVIRVLGAEGKGLLVLLTSVAGILAMLAQLGMPASSVFLLRSGRCDARTLLAHFAIWSAAATVVIAGAGALGMRAFAALFLDDASVSALVALFVLLSFVSQLLIAFTTNLLLAQAAVQQYAQLTAVMHVGTLALTLVLTLALPLGVPGALAAVVMPQLAAAAWGAARLAGSARTQPTRISRAVFRDMLRIGIGHYAGTVGSQMFKRLDSFLVAYFLGTGPVGYYAVAMTAYEGMLSIPRALSAILGGEASARGADRGGAMVARASRVVLCVMLLTGAAVAVASPWIVPLIYGADFILAVAPLQILLAAAACVGMTIAVQAYFLGIGRPGIGGMLTLLAGALNLILSLWLIPTRGIVGNALATLLAGTVSLGLHLAFFRKHSGRSMAAMLVCNANDLAALLAGLRSAGFRRGARSLSRPLNEAD
ncbi:MAG TPA: oligosaccharide flippase family protein [Longimicrobiales bacterium]|nr:oligosaccharide flippase family protein [Longimicrobiales bacterium]